MRPAGTGKHTCAELQNDSMVEMILGARSVYRDAQDQRIIPVPILELARLDRNCRVANRGNQLYDRVPVLGLLVLLKF